MAISATLVKELRERTGSGMMECKKALTETNGDIDAAIALMRTRGLAKADQKSGRTAAEGLIAVAISEDGRQGAMVEVNCETDFVAGGDDFRNFTQQVVNKALAESVDDPEALGAQDLGDGKTVNEARLELVAKIGENVQVRRVARLQTESGQISSYQHGTRIGVMVAVESGDAELGRDIAMHIAASRPLCVEEKDVPADVIEKERGILVAQAEESGRPKEIIEKMVEGRLNKFLSEMTLTGQPFVKEPDQTVGALLKSAGAKVTAFARFEVGEGIERKQENFADEVMAQVRGS